MKEKAARNERVPNPYIPPTSGCPINRLPPELLAYIFTVGARMEAEENSADWQMDDDYVDSDYDSASDSEDSDEEEEGGPEFQVLVSHVCRRWREVALETPNLWTSIDFTEGPPFEKSRAWVERSKGAPLDIAIDCQESIRPASPLPGEEHDYSTDEDEYKSMTLEDLSTALSIIIPHVEHWRSFELMVHDYKFMYLTLSELSKCPSAPMLEGMQLYHYDDWDEVTDHMTFNPKDCATPFVLFNNNAPKLHTVALWGVHLRWSDTTFLSGLVDLELAYHTHDVRPSLEDWARMLTESPELKILTLSASGPKGELSDWVDDDGRHIHSITLPSLTDLVLAFHPTPYVCGIMKMLTVPNLRHLTLDFDTMDGDQTPLISQLVEPRPGEKKSLLNNLLQLKIGGLVCERPVMNDLLGALTNLRVLNINVDHTDPVLFEKLGHPIAVNEENPRDTPLLFDSAAASNTPMYCPLLDTITTTGVDGEQMRAFIEARRKAGVPIKRVCMNEVDPVNDSDEEWITSNVEAFELFEGSDDETMSVIELGEDMEPGDLDEFDIGID
ncbi:hypothetical protein GLOTRDRAFT_43416 [Gloeophyllum trabeum ATCC 11539]|uniref:Uncharacterized protein n=1 Tax=Gloeophyllum trabeum (strain ATCC 11539 / FP-39264 / Madison 617) TaxID=670483 RepID=S7RKP7_GLOTA|nr:uncharacterized protein GLOTRDRAFT_43416 [Gloeophyllum trabeum ATCC 11539]EPQ54945.1 hypothetical protein GLOTRDRAFT_43416 [Gloeophyllum trabeum ATCC 11539]